MPRRLLFRVSGAGFISFALVLTACSEDTRQATRDPASSNSNPATAVIAQDAPIDVCIHNRLSQWECPDSLPNMTLVGEVQSVTVSVTMANGSTFSYPLSGNTDGIFLTKPSTRMFLLPYYEKTNKGEAEKLKKHLDAGKP